MLKPRLKTQIQKPAEFPQDYITLILETFQDSYKASLDTNERIVVKGAIYPKEMIISITLAAGSIKNMTCIASMEMNTKKYTLDNHVHMIIDSMGCFFDEYFESDRETVLPEQWTKYELGDEAVYMKMTTENEDLEEKANELLKH